MFLNPETVHKIIWFRVEVEKRKILIKLWLCAYSVRELNERAYDIKYGGTYILHLLKHTQETQQYALIST